MSKTTKKYKGKEYKPRKHENKKKAKGDKKFFGFTSGAHSRGITDVSIEEDSKGKKKIVYKKSDRAPKKGKDFVKYGWPMETRNKKAVQNSQKEKEAKKQIKEATGR